MPDLGECAQCGSTEFTQEHGMYFCNECLIALPEVSQFVDQNASQYDQEVEEEAGPSTPNKTPSINKNKIAFNKKHFTEYTSWEIYNYVLKGWVDELVSIGADPELKTVTLQIWAKVLSLSKIAFFSMEKPEKPRLGFKSKKVDGQILYGVKNIQKDLFGHVHKNLILRGNKKKETKLESKVTRKRKLKKDLLNITKSEQEEALLEASQMNTTLDSLRLDEKEKEEKVVNLNPIAKKALDDAIKRETEISKNLKDETLPINFTTLVAVLRVALIVIEMDLLVSDLFRLSDEHVLSLFNIEKVVPSKILDMCDSALYRVQQHATTLLSVSNWTMKLLRLLNISYHPNLEQVCSRYCKELQLPDAVAEWASYLLESYSLFETVYSNKNWSSQKDQHDILAVACIIFVLKLLFSLDDVTERKQSEVAAAVNKKIRKKNIQEPLLFEWNKWQEYITCRKAVVGMHHYPTFLKLHQNMKFDADLLLNHHQKQVFPHNSHKSELVEFVSTILKELDSNLDLKANGKLNLPDIGLRPSMLPLSRYLEQLLTEHKDRIPAAVVTQLQQDFPSTSLKYLMDDDYLETLSAKCGLSISVTRRIDKSLSIKKINEIQRLDRFPTDTRGAPAQGNHLNAFFIPRKSTDRVSVLKSETALNSPPMAFELLKAQSSNCDSQPYVASPPKKKKKEDCEVLEQKKRSSHCKMSRKCIVISKMSSRYWVSCIKPWNELVGDPVEFDILLSQSFPTSFVWLLKECCFLLNCTPNDLYRDVCAIENAILSKYPDCDELS